MNGEFVAAPVSGTGQAMEDVLDLYAEPNEPNRPVVCFDVTSTQLLADVRQPLPAQPGRPRRQDYEYRRGGTRNLFLYCEPLAGWRVWPLTNDAITERRTMQDFAHQHVPYLVIHDDRRGMYLRAELEDEPVDNDRRTAVLTIHTPSVPEKARCTAILVPFPRRVMLDALEVTAQAGYWIEFGKQFGVIEKRKVVSRKLLVRSNSYKQRLIEDRRSLSKSNG